MTELFSDAFMPHGHCYFWNRTILGLHVGSDAVIALSYLSIPIVIAWFTRHRRDLDFPWVLRLFGAFILACGLTHAASIVTTWKPWYGAEGLLKAVTAAISLATAVVLWPLLPKALALPSPAELALLRSVGFEVGQGRLLGPDLPLEELDAERLRRGPSVPVDGQAAGRNGSPDA